MKSRKWYCKFPCDAYAMGVWEFDSKISEREFRAYVRKWENINRLPIGFECWITR